MIKWVFRWLFRLLILLIVLLVAVLLLLDSIARELTEYRIQQQTGLETKIGRMHVGLLEDRLTIENLVIYNSAEFGGAPLLEMPELHLECDRNPLFHSNFHFKLIRLNLAQLNVVEDTKGRKNLDVLAARFKKSGGPVLTQPILKTHKAAKHEFPAVDTLNLSLGRATYRSMKNPRQVKEFAVDIHNQIYTGVSSQIQLKNILLVILLSRENLLGSDGQLWLGEFGLQKPK